MDTKETLIYFRSAPENGTRPWVVTGTKVQKNYKHPQVSKNKAGNTPQIKII